MPWLKEAPSEIDWGSTTCDLGKINLLGLCPHQCSGVNSTSWGFEDKMGSVQFSCSVVSDSATPWIVAHQLPESTQTHVHWVCDAIQSSHPLSSPSPPVLNLSQHQGLFKWVSSPRFTQTLRKACASGLVSLSALCLDLPLWFLKACQVLPLGLVKNELLYFISSCDLLLNLGLPPSPCAPLNVLIWQIHNTLINFPV